jgi:hypothetical protein
MANQIIAKEQAIPVLGKHPMSRHYVNVVRPHPTLRSLNEKRVPRRSRISESRSPKIIVAPCFQDWHDLFAGETKAARFNQNVDDRFGREAGHGSTSEMFDSKN